MDFKGLMEHLFEATNSNVRTPIEKTDFEVVWEDSDGNIIVKDKKSGGHEYYEPGSDSAGAVLVVGGIEYKYIRDVRKPEDTGVLGEAKIGVNEKDYDSETANIKVYDNDGKTFDRYTVVIDGSVYSMSHNATSPQGVDQYAGELKDLSGIKGKDDKEVPYDSLPKSVKDAIRDRMFDDGGEEGEVSEAKGTSKIKVKHPGILAIPEGKSFSQMPLSHYVAIAKEKGKPAVMKALLNLWRWNKKKAPEVSAQAKSLIDKLKKNTAWKAISESFLTPSDEGSIVLQERALVAEFLEQKETLTEDDKEMVEMIDLELSLYTGLITEEVKSDINQLKLRVKEGDTIVAEILHVSKSGLQREINLIAPDGNTINWLVARILGERLGKNGGVVVRGVGMDMIFYTLHRLSNLLFGKDDALKYKDQ